MIDREKMYTYFSRYHGNVQPSTNGYHSCDCPICGGRQKFALNFNYLTGRCWRGCFSGFLIDVIKQFHGVNYFEAHELVDSMPESLIHIPASVNRAGKNSKISLPRGFHSILDGTGSLAVRAREYLENRNFDLNLLDRLGVGYVNTEDSDPLLNFLGYIIIPFKREGSLIYYIGRDFIGNYKRYKNPPTSVGLGKAEVLFNEEALYTESKIYITEGWSCSATIGKKGVSIQGSIPSLIQKNMFIKAPVTELVIIPDAQFYPQGLQAAKSFIQHKKVKVINLDQFQIDGIGKDVAEIGVENLYMQEAKTPYMDSAFLYHQMKVYNKMPIK